MSPQALSLGAQSVKKLFFDRLAEGNKVVKTSNSNPKCMWILEWGAMGAPPVADKAT